MGTSIRSFYAPTATTRSFTPSLHVNSLNILLGGLRTRNFLKNFIARNSLLVI